MKRYAIIVAGGQGTRMKSDLPKQFLVVNNKPLLMHTFKCFEKSNSSLVLVLNQSFHPYWKSLCDEYSFIVPHLLVAGGETRAQSVHNGLKAIEGDSLVAVHDAVRPLVSAQLIENLFEATLLKGNAIPVIPIRDSMRKVSDEKSETVDRASFRIVQTPQCFHTNDLLKAFELPGFEAYTDEASLFEKAGYAINLIEGEHTNIKITFPEDVFIAAALLS